MKADTTKQRLLNTGLFAEGGSAEDHTAFLVLTGKGAVLGGEVPVFVRTILRFNSAGELTSVAIRVSESVAR